jgi:dUTPase
MRIAQMVISPVIKAKFEETSVESNTERGTSGFGSTGTLLLA